MPKGQTHYHAHIRKLHGLIARIATILHIWQHQEPDKELVSKHDVLLAEYIVLQVKKHAEYAFSPDGLCAYYDAQKITDWIKRHRYPSFTSTDVAKGVENMRNENIAVRLRVKKKVQNLNAMWYKEFAKNFATQGDFGHESP